MKALHKKVSLTVLSVFLTSCSLDPAHRQDSWTITNNNDKNLQAMLANPRDWKVGHHDQSRVAPLAVEAIERYMQNKIPALPAISANSKSN